MGTVIIKLKKENDTNIIIQKKEAFKVAGINAKNIEPHPVRKCGMSCFQNTPLRNWKSLEAVKAMGYVQ